jgi:hypothetical protein
MLRDMRGNMLELQEALNQNIKRTSDEELSASLQRII